VEIAWTPGSCKRNSDVRRFDRDDFYSHSTVDSGEVCRSQGLRACMKSFCPRLPGSKNHCACSWLGCGLGASIDSRGFGVAGSFSRWRKLKFGRPASSSATISASTTVSWGRSRRASKTCWYSRLKDLRLLEYRLSFPFVLIASARYPSSLIVHPLRTAWQFGDRETLHRFHEASFAAG
jgi:hypothetical protein